MIAQRDELRIGTLRARGTATDQPAQRLSLERALGQADLLPPGMSPDAVLFVRRIRQSIPLAAQESNNNAWADMVRNRLEALYRSAARPQRGRVASDAEAVLFADRSEMLAALARDLADGSAWRRWWWQALLTKWPGNMGPSRAIGIMLREEVERLPAVMTALHAWGDVTQVLLTLDAPDIRQLLVALAVVYELRLVVAAARRPGRIDVMSIVDSASEPRQTGRPGEKPSLSATFGDTINESAHESSTTPANTEYGKPASPSNATEAAATDVSRRIATIAAELPYRLDGEAALLLGLSLALTHEPWRARHADYQAAALVQWCSPLSPSPAKVGTTQSTATDYPAPSAPSAQNHKNTQHQSPDTRINATDATSRDTKPIPAIKTPPDEDWTTRKYIPAAEHSDETSNPMAESPDVTTTTTPHYGNAEALTTNLGGVLYLINLMTALELPECLDDDWQLSRQLGPWAMLELLGRALLHDHADDPLWAALAELDGRDPALPPGHDLTGNSAYRIPRGWIEALADDTACYRWASADGWLRIWSEAGWMLAEVPRSSEPAATQARRELNDIGIDSEAVISRAAFAAAPLAQGVRPAGAACNRLLALILPYVRRRMALAMGIEHNDHNALAALLYLRAQIYLSSSHIDLVARMEDISLAARRAGLDRDPGWLPSFGRVLLFHFE